jgi:hypothetical protein
MKTRRTLLSALLASTLASCISYGTYQTVPLPDLSVTLEEESHARVYVIRADQLLWQSDPLLVYSGDELIGSLSPGSYLCWERGPGRLLGRLVLDAPSRGGDVERLYDVHLEAGDVRWMQVSMDLDGQNILSEILDPAAGAALTEASTVAEPKQAPSGY